MPELPRVTIHRFQSESQLLYACCTLVCLDQLCAPAAQFCGLSHANHSASLGSNSHAHEQDNINSYIGGTVI